MIERLFALTKSPLFGLAISFLAYRIGVYVFKRVRNPLLSPLVVSTAIVISVLVAFNVPVENYSAGGAMLSFMLGPSVIVLSVPLYRNFELLKSHYVAILAGIFAGTLASITSILLLSKLLGIDRAIIVSMIPKSVTTAIGLEISKETRRHSAYNGCFNIRNRNIRRYNGSTRHEGCKAEGSRRQRCSNRNCCPCAWNSKGCRNGRNRGRNERTFDWDSRTHNRGSCPNSTCSFRNII